MYKSRYESRAKILHPKGSAARAEVDVLTRIPPQEYWDKNVKDRESALEFYRKYYPALPDVAVIAIVNRIDASIKGEETLSDQWLKSKQQISVAEQLQKEISDLKRIGLENRKNNLIFNGDAFPQVDPQPPCVNEIDHSAAQKWSTLLDSQQEEVKSEDEEEDFKRIKQRALSIIEEV